ncbi:MAG: hypothetical protein KDK39_07850 [Leptospiraceae bacterium]|nr:hypothetical protein [Leptospiraceae bacterium]
MQLENLKAAEKDFLKRYPGGFRHAHFADMEKKHKMGKHTSMAQESFAKSRFKEPGLVLESIIKLVGQSSMVSVFEKPKFRDFARSLGQAEQIQFVNGYKKFLHDKNQKAGFEMILNVLDQGKLAKWSLITIIPAYYHPDTEVFIKPTTAKGVLAMLAMEDLHYKPRPSWEFYEAYRALIMKLKQQVSADLSPSNAAFSGFLMMSLK